ncbi:MAG: ankyrin repeat domain-containing protein [Chlamydiia bacterium]|nr:ankyrin repeat domain-containing protein [Chlamydiia bacterium]
MSIFKRMLFSILFICSLSTVNGSVYRYFFPHTNPTEALEEGDLETAKSFIEDGSDVEQVGLSGKTLLLLAISKENEEFTQFLLEKGANPNSKGTTQSKYPLRAAISKGNAKLVELLLQFQADPNLGEENFLKDAVKQGASKEIIQLLIDFKGDTQGVFDVAKTPEMTSILLSCGLPIDGHTEDLAKQLSKAAEEGNEAFVAILLESGIDPNDKGGYYKKPLERALNDSKKKSLRVVELLVEHGASIEGMLHHAPTPEIAEYLLMKGCEIDEYDSNGMTPLMCVDTKVAAFLVQQGAHLEKKNDRGATALAIVASRGKKEKCQLLIKSGANLETKDDLGMTPLSRAVDASQLEITRLLLESGANINATDNHGMTPLMHCSVRGNVAITTLLLKNGADRNTQTTQPVYYEQKDRFGFNDPFAKRFRIPVGANAAEIAQIFSNNAVRELIEEQR